MAPPTPRQMNANKHQILEYLKIQQLITLHLGNMACIRLRKKIYIIDLKKILNGRMGRLVSYFSWAQQPLTEILRE